MKKQRTTLKDIAQEVGVSINAVSSVLNPRSPNNIGVSANTRSRIMAAARRLNYQRNMAAAHLAGIRTKTVGILLTNLLDYRWLPVADAFEAEVNRLGYHCFIGCTRYDGALKLDYVRSFLQHRVDGLLLNKIWNEPEVNQAMELISDTKLPIAFAHTRWQGFPAPVIQCDNYRGGQLLARHLLEVGHRTFIYLASAEDFSLETVQARISGARAEVTAAGISPENFRAFSAGYGTAEDYAEIAFAQLRGPNPPSVIMVCDDLSAVDVLAGLRAKGIRVPEDVAMTGFDDAFDPFIRASVHTQSNVYPWTFPLTTVRRPHRDIGRKAAQVLIEMIEKQLPLEAVDYVLHNVELVIRDSSRLPERRKVSAKRILRRRTPAGANGSGSEFEEDERLVRRPTKV
ncbi:MAG TPA: LacI family DNA-binding transcriptional regulator [Candidatus Sumerlaeota bacterium]|nr:LacI family DNA-binding transcriptional regulator [Candidatus Sumerlaeota bacterium]